MIAKCLMKFVISYVTKLIATLWNQNVKRMQNRKGVDETVHKACGTDGKSDKYAKK